MTKSKLTALTGGQAAAQAMRQINPGVVAAYPITPQTPIIETFAKFVANGRVNSRFVCVESEHSSLSTVVGAQATGVRAMTATASAGLALMHEILGVASGLRLPIVMQVANRALSAPINIHADHSDSMASRDMGWMQIYSENPQEVYDNTLLALRLAEHPDVQLPAMVCQDGFITSHCVEGVEMLSNSKVQQFIGTYKPRVSLANTKKPVTLGPLVLYDHYFDIKELQFKAMQSALKVFVEMGRELRQLTGRHYPYFDTYNLKQAEVVLVLLGSTAGTAKVVAEQLNKQGKKVGILKPRLYRPFPYQAIATALENIKVVGVLDRGAAYGGQGALYSDVVVALNKLDKRPKIEGYTYGLGGADASVGELKDIVAELEKK